MPDLPTQIELQPGEGAIVFSEQGIKMFVPETIDAVPVEVMDSMEFVTYALMKPEWLVEFYESISTAEALLDLMGRKELVQPPELRLIKGGMYGKEKPEKNKEEKSDE